MLKITIEGAPNSGKTSLAFALECFLLNRGFKVSVVDPDLGHLNGRTYEYNDKCLEVVAAREPIEIVTKSLLAASQLGQDPNQDVADLDLE